MNLTDIFERVVILNLDARDDRRKRMTERLQAAGLADVDKVIWHRAVNGSLVHAPAWFMSGNGAWGCLMSHFSILSTAIMDRVESVLILEDDVIFAPEARVLLNQLWKQWPEKWGQVYFGGQHLSGVAPSDAGNMWFAGTNVNRTHCHGFHRSVMQEAARHIMHAPDYIEVNGNWHVDHQFGKAHGRGDWPVHASRWWIAGQEAGVSNISSQLIPEMWWQQVPDSYVPPIVLIPEGMTATQAAANRQVHCGNSLVDGTCRDSGLDAVVNNATGLRAYLRMIASEALLHRRLPAVQHPGLSEEALEDVWEAPCYACGPEDWEPLNRDQQRRFYDSTLSAVTTAETT